MCRLTAACVSPSSSLALVKLRCRAAASKLRSQVRLIVPLRMPAPKKFLSGVIYYLFIPGPQVRDT